MKYEAEICYVEVAYDVDFGYGITGKSITILCNFQDFQAESSPVLSEADVRKRFNLARTGAIKAVSAVR